MLELNKLYNMDCMEGMKHFPNKYFLAMPDPPYGINAPDMTMGSNPKRNGRDKRGEIQYGSVSVAQTIKKNRLQRLNGGGGKLKHRALNTMPLNWDHEKPSPEYFTELFRVSHNQIICGGNYFPLPPTRGIVCWDKIQPWDNFSQFELIWTSFDTPAKMFRFSNKGGANSEKKIHPTQKPVELYWFFLKTFAKPGDIIIDTHAGSCSSVIACIDLGFPWIAFEKDKDNYLNAQARIEAHISKGLTLFNKTNYTQSALEL